MKYDIVVIGAGIVGLATALKLKEKNVLNAPSPAATSSLAIGDKLSDRILNKIKNN